MRRLCEHYWCYEHTVYSGDMIRRWCSNCGRIEAAKAVRWRKSRVGPRAAFGEYPDGYPEQFKGRDDEQAG